MKNASSDYNFSSVMNESYLTCPKANIETKYIIALASW